MIGIVDSPTRYRENRANVGRIQSSGIFFSMSTKVEIFLLLRGKELIKNSKAIPSSGFYLCFIRPIVLLISAQRENIFSTFPLANIFFLQPPFRRESCKVGSFNALFVCLHFWRRLIEGLTFAGMDVSISG